MKKVVLRGTTIRGRGRLLIRGGDYYVYSRLKILKDSQEYVHIYIYIYIHIYIYIYIHIYIHTYTHVGVVVPPPVCALHADEGLASNWGDIHLSLSIYIYIHIYIYTYIYIYIYIYLLYIRDGAD